MKKVLIHFADRINDLRARRIHRELNCKEKLIMFTLRFINITIFTFPRLRNRRIANRFMESVKSARQAPRALLIGNSPSSNQLDIQIIKELQRTRNLEVFVMNSFYKSSLSLGIDPDYIILSDPTHLSSCNSSEDLWTWMRNNENLKIVCPASWETTLSSESSLVNPVYYFNDDEALFKTRSINPTKPRSYPSLTAMKGLAVVGFMGYQSICIIGIDNSQFESFSCDANNRISLSSNHNAPDYQSTIDLTEIWDFSSADYFYDVSVIFRAFRLFRNLPIVNLNPESYVDSFEKNHKSEFILPEFWLMSERD
jgi:hypothetical protein